jgi:hypothetical protein
MYRGIPPRVIKPSVNRKNPDFPKEVFYVYMPAMQQFVETPQGEAVFNEYKKIASGRVFKSMWGDEWEEGMSLLIAHFLTLWAQRAAPASSSMSKSIAGIAAMGAPRGIQTSISAGELSKSWDFGLTTLPTDKENAFYNKTEFGQDFYARLIQKRSVSIAVVT